MNKLQRLKEWVENKIKLAIQKGDFTDTDFYVQIMELIEDKEQSEKNG